ncbi:MAG: translation elongation factor Ts [Anaplasmataceae bacterium]|nr:translation elongation factor Ts [Anaplasmataceae bacterium]
MSITAKDIQQLRDLTGAGVMECKKALEEAEGNIEEAVKIVHERGMVKVSKRSDREAGAGLIESYIHNERIGVLIDLRAETDFVVRSDDFKKLAKELAMQIAAVPAENIEELLEQPYMRDDSKTIDSVIKEVAARVGENIKLKAFSRLEL